MPGARLTLEEREEISRGLVAEESFREIAGDLDRPASTVSREVGRNGGRARYRAWEAHQTAQRRARRPRPRRLARCPRLARKVERRLETRHSSEQVAHRLPDDSPEDEGMRISHETIYQELYLQGRGALREELTDALRTGRARRRPKGPNPGRDKEMVEHVHFTIDTGVDVYFCDPHSPWQRGTAENTNRLLRQYLPRKLDFSTLSHEELDKIAAELNERPRETLD